MSGKKGTKSIFNYPPSSPFLTVLPIINFFFKSFKVSHNLNKNAFQWSKISRAFSPTVPPLLIVFKNLPSMHDSHAKKQEYFHYFYLCRHIYVGKQLISLFNLSFFFPFCVYCSWDFNNQYTIKRKIWWLVKIPVSIAIFAARWPVVFRLKLNWELKLNASFRSNCKKITEKKFV